MKTAAATNIASRQNPVKQGMVARGADNLETRYKDMNGNEVFVSLSILNDYLCPGGNFAPQEAYVYLKLCEMGGKYPFRTLVLRDHMKDPFAPGVVKKTVRPLLQVLESYSIGE